MWRTVILVLAAALPAFSASTWIKLTTPDFELYTTAGEKTGRETILHFEQVHDFFLKASPLKKKSDAPVRLVQFANPGEYRPYTLNEASAAYYVSTAARDYIVMGDAGLDFSAATHEYMHLVVNHSGLHVPVWLNEGWADVYSSLRAKGKNAAIGDLLPARMAELQRSAWLDFDTLTSVNQKSPIYNEAARAGIFYGESWALVHMLYLSPEYSGNFGRFVMALHQGKSAADACQIAWGRSSGQVFADLKAYFGRKKIFGREFETSLAKEQENPVKTEVAEFDAQLVLAELLSASNKPEQARAAYDRLEKEAPDRADLNQSLGYFAVGNGDRAAARKYFGKAFEEGDSDAPACLLYAIIEREAGGPPARVIAALERALKSRPGYTDAEIQLGLVKIAVRDFAGGIEGLLHISEITPEQAPGVFCGLAYAYLETGDLAAARGQRDTCSKWAKAESDTRNITTLTRLIDARAKPEAAVHAGEILRHATAMARNLDCSTTPRRLQVMDGNNLLNFELPEPDAIEITRTSGGVFTFNCGPLSPVRMGIDFAPPRSPVETSVGIVRRLQF